MPSPPRFHALDRRRSGAHEGDVLETLSSKELSDPVGSTFGKIGGRCDSGSAEYDVDQSRVRRIWRAHSPFQLLDDESVIIVCESASHGVVRGESRLNQNLPSFW